MTDIDTIAQRGAEALQTPVGPNEAGDTPIAQETAEERPLRTFSDDARTAESVTRVALAAVRKELADLRAERDGPLAERIRRLVADEVRLARCVAVYDREQVST